MKSMVPVINSICPQRKLKLVESHPMLPKEQCDQIGRFLKFSVKKCLLKEATLCAILKYITF